MYAGGSSSTYSGAVLDSWTMGSTAGYGLAYGGMRCGMLASVPIGSVTDGRVVGVSATLVVW